MCLRLQSRSLFILVLNALVAFCGIVGVACDSIGFVQEPFTPESEVPFSDLEAIRSTTQELLENLSVEDSLSGGDEDWFWFRLDSSVEFELSLYPYSDEIFLLVYDEDFDLVENFVVDFYEFFYRGCEDPLREGTYYLRILNTGDQLSHYEAHFEISKECNERPFRATVLPGS